MSDETRPDYETAIMTTLAEMRVELRQAFTEHSRSLRADVAEIKKMQEETASTNPSSPVPPLLVVKSR